MRTAINVLLLLECFRRGGLPTEENK